MNLYLWFSGPVPSPIFAHLLCLFPWLFRGVDSVSMRFGMFWCEERNSPSSENISFANESHWRSICSVVCGIPRCSVAILLLLLLDWFTGVAEDGDRSFDSYSLFVHVREHSSYLPPDFLVARNLCNSVESFLRRWRPINRKRIGKEEVVMWKSTELLIDGWRMRSATQ